MPDSDGDQAHADADEYGDLVGLQALRAGHLGVFWSGLGGSHIGQKPTAAVTLNTSSVLKSIDRSASERLRCT